MLNAPEGHLFTVAMISSDEALSILIQGWVPGWNTAERLRTQLAEWLHLPDCHTTVISPLEYSLVMLLLSMGL